MRAIFRGTAATLIVAVLSTAGALSAKALRARGETSRTVDTDRTPTQAKSETLAVTSVATGDSAAQSAQSATSSVPAVEAPSGAPQPTAPASAQAVANSAASVAAPVTKPTIVASAPPTVPLVAPMAPTIAMGQTSLPDGVMATRTDSGVTLAFDAPSTRTRIPEKFEHLVRATLPQVYGHAVDGALAKIPAGGLARQGNLVSELPNRGIRVPVNEAWTLAVYPETRPGHDGPLVVRYRTALIAKR